MAHWLVWLLCALAFVATPARAEPGVFAVGSGDRHELSHGFTYLEDPSAELTLDDILKPAAQAAFRQVSGSGHGANFGFTRAAIWLRITLTTGSNTPREWLLELAYPPLDNVELFTPGYSGFERLVAGDRHPFSSRPIPHRNHVLPVSLEPGAATTLYLRLTSEGTVVAPVTLWRPLALWQHDHAAYGALSLYFGLLIGLFCYNLLLFISVRDIGYLVYVGFVASMAAGQAALTGVGAEFLWPEWVWWNNVLPVVALSLSAVFGLQFARHFLSSPVRMRRLDRFMVLQMAGWGGAMLAGLVAPYGIAVWIVTFMAVLGVVSMVVVGIISVRRGFAGARLFFTAWAVLLAGVFTLALHNSGVLPSNGFTANSLLIGSALEMVLLSFALADRINVARRFKEMAQERLAAEHALVGALRQAQERLTGVLQEREAMLHSMGLGIVLSVAGRIEWVNRKFAQMVGYPADTLPGHSSQDLEAHPGAWERFRAEARAALAAAGSFACEHELRRADGAVLRLAMSGTCLHERDPQRGVLWTFAELPAAEQLDFDVSAPLPAADPVLPD
jgi:PAS domain S-box-containing protein